jgi:hypothetical protein
VFFSSEERNSFFVLPTIEVGISGSANYMQKKSLVLNKHGARGERRERERGCRGVLCIDVFWIALNIIIAQLALACLMLFTSSSFCTQLFDRIHTLLHPRCRVRANEHLGARLGKLVVDDD